MNANPKTVESVALDQIHSSVRDKEFGLSQFGVTYLNTGGVGRKPRSVMKAMSQGWVSLNINPTRATFLDDDMVEKARTLAAKLFHVDEQCLLLTDSTTAGLQLVMQSFLKNPSDELVTTDREHRSVETIIRHLEDTRGITVRRIQVEEGEASNRFCLGMLNLISSRTKLVLVSEIDCHTGWRPDLTLLAESLTLLDVPLLVDGAHAPGNGPCRPGAYPLWVGAGHKWLGGPNSTAFLHVEKELIPLLEPIWLGDGYFERRDAEIYDLTRFECKGTRDVVKWTGLEAALSLYAGMDESHLESYQEGLVRHLMESLKDNLPVKLRSPGFGNPEGERQAGMVTFYFPEGKLKVADLRQALWEDHKIWIQPDFLNSNPGLGARISCHYSLDVRDLDRFVNILREYLA